MPLFPASTCGNGEFIFKGSMAHAASNISAGPMSCFTAFYNSQIGLKINMS